MNFKSSGLTAASFTKGGLKNESRPSARSGKLSREGADEKGLKNGLHRCAEGTEKGLKLPQIFFD